MTIANVSVAGLESYQPAVDYRKSNKVGVLSGKNFAWDASGVYSAYASRLVATNESLGLAPAIVQSLDVETDMHVAIDSEIKRLVPSSPGSPVGSWQDIDSLAALVDSNPDNIDYNYRKWTTAYLGYKPYACAYNYGVFEVDNTLNPPVYTRLTDVSVPGFPADTDPVIAIAETNGRMLYLTELNILWSAPNAPKNLVPALGGAGFQVIAERIAGKPFAITATSVGAIVWTSSGALVCEFIGGDQVFRFWVLATNALPISSFAITRMPDDDYVLLTRLGLFMFNNMSQPQPITPLFNEFLREYLRSRPLERGHVWYSITDNRLYASMKSGFTSFVETFSLDIMLDRWGIFSDRHMGFFDYGTSRGQLAYANANGIASFLLSPQDARKNKENPAAPGTYIGLGSEILIGWIRAENLVPHADTVQELHEALIFRQAPFLELQDTFIDEGVVGTPSPPTFDEGLVTAPITSEVDEGVVFNDAEPVNYRLEAHSDLFTYETPGGDTNAFPMELVRRSRRSDLWVGIVPSIYHRFRLIATEPDEFYRLNAADFTVAYSGNIS